MTRDEAVSMIQVYFRTHGVKSPGLNERNLGGAAIGEHQIYFEFRPDIEMLKCSALIYRFHDVPRAGVLEAFRAEEESRSVDGGGGMLEYEPQNKGLYLSRAYRNVLAAEEFARDMERLMNASDVYGGEVLDRVADRLAS